MGSFQGHAMPGTFFLLFGLWYVIQAFRRYFKCRESGATFKSTATFPCSCVCGKWKHWPLEPIVKICCIVLGFVIELIAGVTNDHAIAIGNGQHATMFAFFGLSAIVDILTHFKIPIPPNTDYIAFAMALAVEALLFNFHLYGRTPLDVLVHTLLVYTVLATVVCVLAEMKYRHSLLSPLSRGYLLIVQGTWFWQVGNILYPPLGNTWNEHDHKQMMLATLYFTWHAGADFIAVLLIGGVLACRYRRRPCYSNNGVRMSDIQDVNEDSSDVEFQKPES